MNYLPDPITLLAVKEGKTYRQTGKLYGVSGQAVFDRLKRANLIEVGHRSHRKNNGSEELYAYLKQCDFTPSYKQMIEKMGVGKTAVDNYLQILESEGKIVRVRKRYIKVM
jgi:hypothetical protein